MKLVYFAWVRERVGKAEETLTPPPEVVTVADLARWLAAAHREGSALTVHEPNGARLTGSFAGLEPDGALRLRLADGAVRVIHAGDVMLGDAV